MGAPVVPLSNNLDDSFDPFSAKNLAKISTNVKQSNKVPQTSNKNDAWGSTNTDPFGSSAWKDDPFSAAPVTRSKTSSDAFADLRSKNNSKSPPKISGPPPNKSLNPLQKSETTASVLKTSQSLSRPWSSSSGTNPGDSFGSIPRHRPKADNTNISSNMDLDLDKKSSSDHNSKKSGGNFKMLSKIPFTKKKDKSGKTVIKNDLGPPSAPPGEAMHLQMASEASKKAELDRLERLRQQEERDLAYAIALSKAEAASQQ